MRLKSVEERAEILDRLTHRLVATNCTDMEILTEVDRLCRRTWGDIHRGWTVWAYYLEGLLGPEKYQAWAKSNCGPLSDA